MAPDRDRFCSACGAAYPPPLVYPRRCVGPDCGALVWANPIPVAVVLVPVLVGARTGLLVVRRGVAPGRGQLALVGGFVEAHERWQAAAAREVREEVGVAIDPAGLRPIDYASTEPRPDRVLLISVAAPIAVTTWPRFVANAEAIGRGVVFGPDGLDREFGFPLHAAAARRWFGERGAAGPIDYLEC